MAGAADLPDSAIYAQRDVQITEAVAEFSQRRALLAGFRRELFSALGDEHRRFARELRQAQGGAVKVSAAYDHRGRRISTARPERAPTPLAGGDVPCTSCAGSPAGRSDRCDGVSTCPSPLSATGLRKGGARLPVMALEVRRKMLSNLVAQRLEERTREALAVPQGPRQGPDAQDTQTEAKHRRHGS